jgi:hypothetical protein
MVMRRRPAGVSLMGCALLLAACSRAPDVGVGSKATAAEPAPPAQQTSPSASGSVGLERRRVVQKASLELEVQVPGDALAAATRLVDRAGGFVASTERAEQASEGRSAPGPIILTLRVPAERFTSVLDGLRRLGSGEGAESVSTEDVSEEFIDLEARIKNQRELEAQFLQILKQATKVEEALNVQREIAGVRTEIDRMEGRRRFLERETALATITVRLVPKRPLVSASLRDFGVSLAQASSDTVNVGASIVTGAIRLFGVLLPLALLVGLPLVFVLRFALRRARRRALPVDAI